MQNPANLKKLELSTKTHKIFTSDDLLKEKGFKSLV